MSPQQKANETLALWHRFRNLPPEERIRRIERYEAELRAVQEAMKERHHAS